MDSLIGASIGGYTLISVLGSGGMGTVYLAEDPAIGQQVAIKVVRTDPDSLADFGASSMAAERFKQEARAVASLDHLHILPLYRYGEEKTSSGQRAYIIMQYRPEGSLWDWLKRRAEITLGHSPGWPRPPGAQPASPAQAALPLHGPWPLPLDEASEYLRQAASALQYAHDRGIIHRDVKPANFLLRYESGRPVHLLLSDFGLAKMFSSASATSKILGTPLYMAPEQFEGAALPESDQYALAVMVYSLLAGHPPFEGEPMRLMHLHLSSPVPPISGFNPALPASVDTVLARALAKRPADRYPSTADFAAAFAQAEQGQQHGAGMQPFLSLPTFAQGARVSPYAPAAAGPLSSTPQAMPQSLAPPILQPAPVSPAQPISAGQGLPGQAQVGLHSPQAFAPTESPQWAYGEPATMPTVSGAPSSLPPAPVLPPVTSERKQGMSRRRALGWILGGAAVAALAGGAGFFFYSKFHIPDHALSVLQGHTDAVTTVSWSPDGSQLASGSRDKTARLWQISSGQTIATYKDHTAAIMSVAWRPLVSNGVQLLASGGDDETVQVWNTQAARRRSFPRLGAPVSSVSWSLDGSYVLAGTLGNGTHALLLSGGTTGKSLARLDIHALAFSPDGSYIAAATESGSIAVVTVQAPHKVVFSRSLKAAALSVAWSPDGTKLAAGFANNTAEVYAFNPGTPSNGHLLRALPHKGAVHSVAWEPASTMPRLATASDDGTLSIWDIASGAQTIYNGYGPAMLSVAWSGSGLATGDANNTVILWQT